MKFYNWIVGLIKGMYWFEFENSLNKKGLLLHSYLGKLLSFLTPIFGIWVALGLPHDSGPIWEGIAGFGIVIFSLLKDKINRDINKINEETIAQLQDQNRKYKAEIERLNELLKNR